jgi:hypothetical protein
MLVKCLVDAASWPDQCRYVKKHAFVGKEIDGIQLCQINYLRCELKLGY